MYKFIHYGVLGTLLFTHAPTWGELRDPMRPYGFQQAGHAQSDTTAPSALDANSLRLSGIFSGPNGKSAVINGHRLRVGDQIDGARLVAIHSHAIELDMAGDIIKIELLPIRVKTPAMAVSGGGE
ncbi:hypothetical protein [Sedimenticola sp.]|uniref:hypothetical protein n=1 Tax=Sedimenticola sp. TaxID=1940285 RepID=UPI003D127463